MMNLKQKDITVIFHVLAIVNVNFFILKIKFYTIYINKIYL